MFNIPALIAAKNYPIFYAAAKDQSMSSQKNGYVYVKHFKQSGEPTC